MEHSTICPSCLEDACDFRFDEDLRMNLCLRCFFEIWLADFVPVRERKNPAAFLEKVRKIRARGLSQKLSFVTFIEVE